jgi:hypothetical protein
MLKKILLKKIKKHGIGILNGMHVTYYEEVYHKNKQGWIGACPLSEHNMSENNSLDYLHIQCDDGFKGARGTSISFDEILSISVNTPMGWKDPVIPNISYC